MKVSELIEFLKKCPRDAEVQVGFDMADSTEGIAQTVLVSTDGSTFWVLPMQQEVV